MAFIFNGRRKPALLWWLRWLLLSFCIAHACAAGPGLQTNNLARACKRQTRERFDPSTQTSLSAGPRRGKSTEHDPEVVAVCQRLLAKHDVGKDTNWKHLWKRTDDGFIAYKESTYESNTTLPHTAENLAAIKTYIFTL